MIRTLRAALAVLAIVAFVAACSGGPAAPSGVASLTEGDASPDASTGPAASVDPETAMLAFAACMREHGIDMPDPVFEGGGAMIARPIDGEAIDPGSAEYQAAEEACHDLLGELGRDGGPSIQVGPGGGGDSGGNVEVKP